MKVKITNLKQIWNKPCPLTDGDIVELDYCRSSGKYLIKTESKIYMKDVFGATIFLDNIDFEEGYVEELCRTIF